MKRSDRREFLKTTALTAAVAATSPLFASHKSTAGEDYKALVCVLLEGGADSLNMVVPQKDLDAYLDYLKVRPNSAHNREKICTLKGSKYGLHPNMRRMQRLYNHGNLAVVANVGVLNRTLKSSEIKRAQSEKDIREVPEQLYGHVAQRDQWMYAGETTKGWAARVADMLGKEYVNVSVAGENTMQQGSDYDTLVAYDDIFGADPMLSKVRKARVDTYFDIDETAEGKSLGEQLDMVLDLIEHRKSANFPKRQIFFVTYSGWDLHNASSEKSRAGQIDQKVAYMDKSFGEFFSALEKLGLNEKVTTFTISDFGRSIESVGDDHGWGGHAFVMGGAVKGGIYGKMPKIAKNSPDALANGAVIPTTSVESYIAPLVAWFGDGKLDVDRLFPNLAKFQKQQLDFIA
jgi:uncharacterized protein (DUF1501 family)